MGRRHVAVRLGSRWELGVVVLRGHRTGLGVEERAE